MSLKSAEIIIMCAFGAHFIKEVSRSQLCAAAKTLLSKQECRRFRGAEKSKLLKPLAKVFLEKKIVSIEHEGDLESLTRAMVHKIGTF